MRLSIHDDAPRGLEDAETKALFDLLEGPSLIWLRGRAEPPLFVSTLLHGNETTSWTIARDLIRRARIGALARTVLLFVGNVAAARAGKRYLPEQLDYNRVWSGGDRPEHALAAEALEIVRAAAPYAVIDIHNNTGRNPLYSCVSRLEPSHLELAERFSPVAVYYTNPPSALSVACSAFAPAIAIECGQSNDPDGVRCALAAVNQTLASDVSRGDFGVAERLTIFHTLGRIVLEDGLTFSFDEAPADVHFPGDIEDRNFTLQAPGSLWARSGRKRSPLRVIDGRGIDLTDQFFQHENGETRLVASATPAMLSTNRENVRLDCFGYLMERVALSRGSE